MFLKSIELNGFKSFAQKTVLEFPKGITAIVGPNGSGKSNIIDAIRWIMGEREVKNLRGAKAEDLIFAGTPKKPRVGIARVCINFDNSSKFFPVDFDEVSIKKEISRDGNSNYLLNKSEVRTKDIIDFFARSRLGTKGITIINQGSSDLFVRATPEERKIMIEEVLGLKEYQLKKSEAERKLKNTASNLEKVKIIIEEVAPRLRTLKRQVVKYQARGQKQEELKTNENLYFSYKAKEIKNSISKNNSSIASFDSQIAEKNKKLNILSENLQQIESLGHPKSSTNQLQEKENNLFEHRSKLQREIGRMEARLEFLSAFSSDDDVFKKDEMFSLIKGAKEILQKSIGADDFKKTISCVKEVLTKIDEFLNRPFAQKSKELENIAKNKEILANELLKIEGEINELKSQKEEISKNLEEFNEKFKKAFELKENKRDEIRKLESQKNYLVFENDKFNARLQDLKHEWLRSERNEAEFGNLKFESQEPIKDIDSMERQILKLRGELMSIGEIDEALVKEAQEVESHYNFLTSQSADLEKALSDLTSLIEELKAEIEHRFNNAFKQINDEFNKFFRLMFGGGAAKLKIKSQISNLKNNGENGEENGMQENGEEKEKNIGVEIELNLPKKKINSLDILSGGEKSLVSIAALFALISVSPPPFLVLDEIDAPLDEKNSQRFANLVKEFCQKVQFILVTHNRTVMECADVLYGITMNDDGTSKLISLKLEEAK